MRYNKLEGIILKKQNYQEADQIVTLWTRENGKVRARARGVRLPKSKLVYSLADLAHVQIETTGRTMPVIIHVTPIRQHNSLLTDLQKAAIAMYAAELILKTTADENPNPQSFEIFRDFLMSLESFDYSVKYYPLLESFSLKLMESLGFSIEQAHRTFQIPDELQGSLTDLHRQRFTDISLLEIEPDLLEKLHELINRFIEFIIERKIKTEPFLWMIKS